MAPDFVQPDFLNWAESIEFRPRGYFRASKSFAADLANLINRANQEDRRVRPIGSAWAFADVAVCYDYLVDTSGAKGASPGSEFNRLLAMSQGNTVWGQIDDNGNLINPSSPVLVGALTTETIQSGAILVHAEAGIPLFKLY